MIIRKKPVQVETVRWNGDNWDEIEKFSPYGITHNSRDNSLKIDTLEGEMTCSLGDYLIKGLKGEYYPCKPDIFEKSYEIVGEQSI